MQLIQARLREQTSKDWGDANTSVPAPVALTFGVKRTEASWLVKKSGHSDVAEPIGLLQAYVCRRCGFTELFTSDPASVPIGEEFGTALIDLSPKSEYR